jgi:hypothetical protein
MSRLLTQVFLWEIIHYDFFVRVILFLKPITNKYPKRQQKYIHFLQQVCEQHGSENREAETGVECTGTNNCHSQRTRYTKSAWLKRKKKP